MLARRKKMLEAERQSRKGRFLRVRTAGIWVLNRCAFVILVLLGCGAVALLSLPQVKELQRLEAEQALVEDEEIKARARLEQKELELEAIRKDPEYLELVARDRLNLHREGETILRIRRENSL